NFYKQLSDVFKNKYAGYDVWIISSNQEALRSFGLRPSKKINLLNGALECKYQRFSMYKGSLKSKQS
ncbi:MAG TPA: RNA methyltransferase, partial [Tenuifilum sp.]|nr:RNA methyltransferase [Tenuifilum sp.]